jgi:hypothetical protein
LATALPLSRPVRVGGDDVDVPVTDVQRGTDRLLDGRDPEDGGGD